MGILKPGILLPALLQRWNSLIFGREIRRGILAGILRDFFRTHKIKAQEFQRKFRSIFCEKICASTKCFAPTSFCRRATQSHIPTLGIPKTGIPRAGIPKVGKTPHWDSPRDRDSKARNSEVRDSENRVSEGRDSEASAAKESQSHNFGVTLRIF